MGPISIGTYMIVEDRLMAGPNMHPSRLNPSSGSSALKDPQRIYPVLSAIFDKIYPVILICAGLALAVSLCRTLARSAWHPVLIMHGSMYLMLVAVFAFRRHLSVPVTFSFLLAIVYIIGAQSLTSLGLAGSSMIHLVMLCAFASVFLGIRAGIISSSVVTVTVILFAIGAHWGIIPTRPGTAFYLFSPANWMVHVACLIMYLAPFVLAVSGLQKRMVGAMRELESANELLQGEISMRKLSQERSEESERRYRELADLLPQAVAEFDLKGYFVYGNLCGLEMFGYTQREFDERIFNLSEMFVTEDLERLQGNIQRVLKGDRPSHGNEYTALRKDGTTFPVMVYAGPVIREGKLSGMRAIAVDITERKNTERAYMESEAKYRSVVESSLVGFYVIQDGKFRFVNRRFCHMMGYASDEIVDKLGPLDGIHPEDKARVQEALKKRLQGDADFAEFDVRAIRKDGKVMTLKIFGNTISYGGRAAVSGTCMDITKERMLESQLRQAQKMEAVGQLAGGMAHDFNNILTALVGFGSLLQMRMDKTNPLRSYVDQILSASQKGADLTKSLLAFSRQQPINMQSVNINNIIRGTEPLLNRLLTGDVSLETRFAADAMTVTVDVTQIDQILFNLVANARDAIQGSGKIVIETKSVTLGADFALIHGFGEPGRYALLSVSDTGKGMDEKVREKIFEPFFTTKESGKGTGLGLSTVYGIVKQHNGYITVYSEPGAGTTFHIHLPIEKTELVNEHTFCLAAKRGHETILVADHSEEARHFMREIFDLYGYAVTEAADHKKIIEELRDNGVIDLLILDTFMLKKGAKNVYEAIISIRPQIKILFVTGHTKDSCLDEIVCDKKPPSISKPLLPDELLQKVRELLDTV
ncbi:MAG TPA: PAS domain S-box protein [Syntrophorhabdaceae bacterium]|nr:PAS domain S-box protein [Syntrophorhabdaceae bacterium]